MKELWERQAAYLELDHPTLSKLVQPALVGQEVAAAALMAGGFSNTLYKVQLAGQAEPVVVRLYTRDAASCQKDIDLYRLLRGQVPIPELLFADPDGTLGGVPYAVTSYAPGTTLADVLARGTHEEIGGAAFAAGQVLARLGTFTFRSSGFFGPGLVIAQEMTTDRDMFRGFIGDCLFARGAGERLGPEVTEQLWTFVTAHAGLLDMLAHETALVHSDFNGPNIMVEQRAGLWSVTAVLDWEFAFAGTQLFDIGNMLRNENRLPPVFAEQFVAGYVAEGGSLPPNWQRLAKLLDLLSLVDFLTRSTGGEPMVRDVSELIVATMERWAAT